MNAGVAERNNFGVESFEYSEARKTEFPEIWRHQVNMISNLKGEAMCPAATAAPCLMGLALGVVKEAGVCDQLLVLGQRDTIGVIMLGRARKQEGGLFFPLAIPSPMKAHYSRN